MKYEVEMEVTVRHGETSRPRVCTDFGHQNNSSFGLQGVEKKSFLKCFAALGGAAEATGRNLNFIQK